MKIYFSNIKESKTTVSEMENRLPNSLLNEARKYKSLLDYRRSLVAYCILFKFLHHDDTNNAITFEISKNEYGKPFLLNKKDCFFNITHSGDWVAVAISDMEVGIDLEYKEPFDYDEVIDYLMSKSEKQFFSTLPCEFKKDIFYRFWTLKESYIKAIGLGMSKHLNSFSIELWHKHIRPSVDRKMKFIELPFFDHYAFSVCCPQNDLLTCFEQVKI